MTLKTLTAAIALLILPSATLAMGCSAGHASSTEQAMSCAEGTMFDTDTGTCVPLTTS